MRIAVLQYDIKWRNLQANLDMIQSMAHKHKEIDLLVLPEMCTSGFDMNPGNHLPSKEEVIDSLKALSHTLNCAIIGSVAIFSNGHYHNRAYLINRDNTLGYYDKNYLFSPAKEDVIYQSGNETNVIRFRGINICPIICYDLRFPELLRSAKEMDLIICMANWPVKRIKHWDQLLIARAIENQCYTVGANRTGVDHNEWHFCGHSQVIDYTGEVVTEISRQPTLLTCDLDFQAQTLYRSRFPFLRDKK